MPSSSSVIVVVVFVILSISVFWNDCIIHFLKWYRTSTLLFFYIKNTKILHIDVQIVLFCYFESVSIMVSKIYGIMLFNHHTLYISNRIRIRLLQFMYPLCFEIVSRMDSTFFWHWKCQFLLHRYVICFLIFLGICFDKKLLFLGHKDLRSRDDMFHRYDEYLFCQHISFSCSDIVHLFSLIIALCFLECFDTFNSIQNENSICLFKIYYLN